MSRANEHASNTVFYDEEECLGFGVFVAELELIVGTSRDRQPDQVQLLEVLQKLQSSISITDSNVVKLHQKRCEAALYGIVYKGACSVVRNYVAVCLAKLYTAGDSLPLYSKVNTLQTFLQDKNNTAAEVVRLGVMDVLSHLTSNLGKYLASSTVESMTIAAKAADKSSSNRMKAAGLRLAACVVEALPYQDRNTPAVQAEAWKLFERQVKDKSSDELRAAGAAVLSAMCRAGGSFLWSSAGYYAEEALRLSVAALDDAASQSTMEACAVALADLAASARRSNPALAAAIDAEKKPAKRQQLEKLAKGMFKAALVQPFVDAAVQGSNDVLTALALSWSAYAATVDLANDPDALVELAVKAVEMLELAHKAAAEALIKGQPAAAEAHNIGACLAGGELPAASAAVIYFIRVSVIRHLPEPGQRKLLAALARATSHAIAPPVIVTALEGCGVLLEILGEVHDEAAIKAVENAAMSKLSASSTAVRHQAAAVLAALALSSPPLLARLFGDCLEGVETFCQQLMLLAAPYNKPRSVTVAISTAAGPGTPRGAPDSQTKHCIDGLHGNALAVGALLVASARSALGAPSRLTRSVFWIAKRMISQPYCSSLWAVAAEREAGYILLGCMCAAAAPGLLTGREKQQQILELFSIALGPAAAEALTGAAAAATGADVAGTDAAVACWWRAAALQALSAYVLGVMGKGYAENAAQQVRLIASLLSPLLEVICNAPHLADPATASSTPTAAAAATQATSAAAARAPSPVGTGAAGSGHPSPRPSHSNSGAAAPAAQSAAAAAVTANGSAATAVGAAFSSPVAAAAAARLQMQLLEVFFFLPGAQLWSHCHGQLLQLCCRQLNGVGGSRVLPEYAAAVANSSLRHMLNSQDALLGPWLPGRDMLEDELRTFVGQPGGPQQHPWEVGAAFTEGFITYSQALLPPDDSETAAAAAATATAAAAVAVGAGGAITAAAAAFADDGVALGGSSSSDGTRRQRRRGADGVRLRRRFMPYPQPNALGPALLESQMWLLGKLLAVVTNAGQTQILEIMLNAVSLKSFSTALSNSATRPTALKQRAANCTAVAVACLAGLGSVAKRARGDAGADKLAERILQLASCMLEDQVSDPCLARAGAEMMAAATVMGSTALASSQVKAVSLQLSAMMIDANAAGAGTVSSSGGTADGAGAGASAELRAVLSLVLGCLHRSKGGGALQPTVKATVDALTAVASRPIGTAHIWALHGLWLVAGAAGPGYAPHVRQSLQLALELLVSSFGENPLLQPAAARLANAMIAVLGPEFTLGSAAYSRCKTLVTCYNTTSSGAKRGTGALGAGAAAAGVGEGIRGLAATWAELEQVLFAQQLILFAPGAVPAAKHLPLLLATLTSSRPALRRAAAATLQHLAERNPTGLAEACIEAPLLAALDAESEPTTSTQLRNAVNTMLVTTAGQKPGYFVRLLGAVALAAAPAAAVTPAGQVAMAVIQADTAEDDDDAERPVAAAAAAVAPAAANSSSSGPASVAAAAAARLPQTPRLRTRLFAAELLLSLFAAVGGDPRHKFPQPKDEEGIVAAGGAAAGTGDQGQQDYLVQHLQPLIDLGYKLTTSPVESLRPSGAQLLQQILRHFGTVADPDVPDMLLLEQYQAQFVAALRAALASGAAPALAVCGGNLAISFLSAGLAAGDGAVMRRLMDLLIAPLDSWQALLYGGYAEAVGVRARVALLQAHAQCANLASTFGSSSGGSAAASGVRSVHGGGSGRGGFGASISPTSSNNDLCRSIVVKSQAPYKDMLLLLWWGLLLDYAAFSSPLPGLVDNHKSLLFGDTYPEVVEAVQGTYASAWPPVLVALASNLPAAGDLEAAAAAQQQQQAAWSTFVDQVSSGAGFSSSIAAVSSSTSRREAQLTNANASTTAASSVFSQQLKIQCAAMHSMLIDVSLLLLCGTASTCAAALSEACDQELTISSSGSSRNLPAAQQQHNSMSTAAVAAAQRAAVALQALQLLMNKQHFSAGLVTLAVCREVAERVGAFVVEVLAPWQQQQYLCQSPPQRQTDSNHGAAGSAADKVFGLVLVAAADLLQSLVVGLPYANSTLKQQQQQQHQHQQQSASAATAAALEALLALMSIAVPYEQYQTSSDPTSSNSSSSSTQAASNIPYAPAHTSSSSGSDGSSSTLPPSPQAVAACSSLCHAASSLIQQQQQQQPDLSGPIPGLISRTLGLGLRLLLTAAPGGQLTAAQQLADCCWTAAAAQQQLSKVTDPTAARAAAVAAAEALGAVAAMTKVLCNAVTASLDQLCRSSSGSSSSDSRCGVADPAARLPVLLPALLSAAACCCCSDTAAEGAAATAAAAAVQQCCGTLQYCLKQFCTHPQQQQLGGVTPAAVVACRVLETVRLLLQDSAAAAATEQQGLHKGKAKLSQMVTAAVVPQVAVLIHEAMNSGRGPLVGAELMAVTEGLKVLLLLANKTAAQGEAAQVAVMNILVPLLIEVAKPQPKTPVTPVLRDMACKLVSAMPTSAAAAAFRTAVVALPAASKQRLHLALKEQAAAAAAAAAEAQAGAGAAVGSVGRALDAAVGGVVPLEVRRAPAIQLKMNFALPSGSNKQ